jgi:hypothetical protein
MAIADSTDNLRLRHMLGIHGTTVEEDEVIA